MSSILSKNASNDKLREALLLAEAGFPIFPVKSNYKTPIIKDWPYQACCDNGPIEKWFNRLDAPNIGLVTGFRSDIFCLDIDGPPGKQSLASLEAKHGELPKICIAETPSRFITSLGATTT